MVPDSQAQCNTSFSLSKQAVKNEAFCVDVEVVGEGILKSVLGMIESRKLILLGEWWVDLLLSDGEHI